MIPPGWSSLGLESGWPCSVPLEHPAPGFAECSPASDRALFNAGNSAHSTETGTTCAPVAAIHGHSGGLGEPQ